tara:strand:- start:343 stop:1047 length:705 start_codon:yes stop_codon:yes gene_type:complete
MAAAEGSSGRGDEKRGVHTKKWESQSYREQDREIWPGRGNHILAQYDEDSVVVYQAFRPEIAEYAVAHQRFTGCPVYGEERMTWIKPNFMWMMFRSNWARKPNQERILAIWLHRDAFDQYLANAKRRGSTREFKGTVRLQWDPDHVPTGERHAYRRAVQLGIKGVPTFADGTDIVCIQDITEFVREQAKLLKKKTYHESLLSARERVYIPNCKQAVEGAMLSLPPDSESIEIKS